MPSTRRPRFLPLAAALTIVAGSAPAAAALAQTVQVPPDRAPPVPAPPATASPGPAPPGLPRPQVPAGMAQPATPSPLSAPAPAPPTAPPYGPLEIAATLVQHPERVPIAAIATAGHRLIAGGRDGVLILSDDDGASWRQLPLPVSSSITDIRFVDDQVGWAVGHDGLVLRTGDGGLHWAVVYDGAQAAQAMLQAARLGNRSDHARQTAVAAAEGLVRQDPGRPFQLIQLSGTGIVRLIGADGLCVASGDGGHSWQPWSAAIDNPKRLQAYGLAARGGVVLVAGAQGLLLAGRPEDGLQAIRSPYDGSLFGAIDGGRYGFVVFGQHGHAFASGELGNDWSASREIGWHRIDDPSPTSLTAGLLRHDGSVVLGDASGATWQLQGKPEDATLAPATAQAPFPILAMAEAGDHALILAGSGGVVRIAP